jgi:hypothetical protein
MALISVEFPKITEQIHFRRLQMFFPVKSPDPDLHVELPHDGWKWPFPPHLYRNFRAKFAHDEIRICNLQSQIYVVSTM